MKVTEITLAGEQKQILSTITLLSMWSLLRSEIEISLRRLLALDGGWSLVEVANIR